MEFAWGAVIIFSALTSSVLVNGDPEKCYDVQTVFEDGCVDTIKVIEDGEVWFSGTCSPPFHLYRLHQGKTSIVATVPDQVIYIVADSHGNPYFTTLRAPGQTWDGLAYTFKNGSLLPLSEDRTIDYLEVDKKDDVYMTSSEAVYRLSGDGEAEKLENLEPRAHHFYMDSQGNNFFLGKRGRFWEIKVDGSIRELFIGGNIRKFIENPNGPGYLAATDTGIYHVNEDTVTSLFSGGSVFDLVSTKDGTLYFSTPGSAFTIRSGELRPIEGLQHLVNTSSISLSIDGNDKIYFLTEHVQVLKPNEESPQLVSGIPSERPVHRVTIDSHNNAFFEVPHVGSVQIYFLAENSLEAHLVDEIKEPRTSSDHHQDSIYIGTTKGLYSLKSKEC